MPVSNKTFRRTTDAHDRYQAEVLQRFAAAGIETHSKTYHEDDAQAGRMSQWRDPTAVFLRIGPDFCGHHKGRTQHFDPKLPGFDYFVGAASFLKSVNDNAWLEIETTHLVNWGGIERAARITPELAAEVTEIYLWDITGQDQVLPIVEKLARKWCPRATWKTQKNCKGSGTPAVKIPRETALNSDLFREWDDPRELFRWN